MKRKRLTEEQIALAVWQHDGCRPPSRVVADGASARTCVAVQVQASQVGTHCVSWAAVRGLIGVDFLSRWVLGSGIMGELIRRPDQ